MVFMYRKSVLIHECWTAMSVFIIEKGQKVAFILAL